ncbi:hypothetical protein L873DRAFT_1827964 [Choiromyces venosus 120613-1]|uniref:Zn(2)-C6 fungal-type domain-containing protein n=1 Tax=Choiromyces venosus 120613-1 TaxID=1336337 RepID=A0A3N4JMX2_9PEZI|nr:hypothetical protein L873DRAFT_1827964 [Choiromyces venosus 120613-1]
MSTTNPDSKRPRLESWGSTSSPLSHEIHHTHSQHFPPQNSSPYSTMSPTASFADWQMKTPPQPVQHTLSHSRSHSVPTPPLGIVTGGKNGTSQQQQQQISSPQQQQQQQHSGHSLANNSSSAVSPHTNPLVHNSGPSPNHGYNNGFQPQHHHQPQAQQVSMDGSTPTPPSTGSTPHLRNATDQQQVQQLRSFSVSSNSSTSAGHPSHYQKDSAGYYGQQMQSQRQQDMSHPGNSGNAAMGDNRPPALLDNISPASSTTLPPGLSPIMTGGFSTNPTQMMSHQHMSASASGLTSPVVTTPSVGGIPGTMMGNPQMNVVTTYPPRRKAIRAAQACDACRARKAKCDEGRPSCGFCKESQIACVYREVPPPKQDRTLLQILERLGRVETLLDSINSGRKVAAIAAPTGDTGGVGIATAPKESVAVNETSIQSLQSTSPFHPPTPVAQQAYPQATAGNAAVQNHHPQPTNPTEVPLEEDEQLTIPVQHTTAAHKLMWWPSIRKNIDEEFLANEGYVMKEEEKRGPLRVYGRGESLDSAGSMFEDMDDRDTGFAWDSGIGVDEGTEGSWRSSEDSPMEDILPEAGDYMNSQRRPSTYTGSGLTTGGGLKLDHQTVLALLNSYLANIHILHPVVDKATITDMVFMFSDRVASVSAASPTTPYSAVAGPNVGLGLGSTAEGDGSMPSPGIHRRNSSAAKRKRSITGIGSMHSMPSSQEMGPSPQRIPRTLHSALALLVMALGSICSHKKPVPGPLPPLSNSPGFRTATPPFKTSSPSYHGAGSPFHSYNQQQQQSGGLQGKQSRELKNIDVIPGLAYFAKAMEIMGVLVGGNELENVQICLLAGLYWGQLGRVLDSWKWINYACMGCQILVRMRLENGSNDLRNDLILRAFWSCLQLESDILAELDLPPSGISRLEDSMPLPSAITDNLSTEDKAKLDSPRSLAIARELDFQLEQWKLHLPEALRWEETDPPPADINAARLRAKYFGARYIIHRPFVYHAIHGGNAMYNAPSNSGAFSTSSPAMSTSEMSQSSPSATTPGGFNSSGGNTVGRRISIAGEGERAELAPISLETSCRKCIDSAISSTTAFHAFSPDVNRPLITNVFGTAHAQFGNLLVLQAAYQSPALKNMVPQHLLAELFQKTVHWLQTLSPISSALRRDAQILENAAAKLDFQISAFTSTSATSATSSSGMGRC